MGLFLYDLIPIPDKVANNLRQDFKSQLTEKVLH